MRLGGAERRRRTVLLAVLLSSGTLAAWWPAARLDAAVGTVTGWLGAPCTLAAGWVLGLVAAPPRGAVRRPERALAELEREAGMPPGLPGRLWLEVPVLAEPARDRLPLGAGADFHLGDDMLVAWGERYLGRLAAVGPTRSEVVLVSSPGVRTGAWLVAPDGRRLEGVVLGRGGALPPVLAWREEGPPPAPGTRVLFRARPGEDPALSRGDLLLGGLRREGEASRGTEAWVVDFALPPGAEGRVFVAASAVGDRLVAEPGVGVAPARPALHGDAVFAEAAWAVLAPEAAARGVLLADGRGVGRVLARRGPVVWVRPLRPEEWGAASVVATAAGLRPGDLVPFDPGDRFTRGRDGSPRGVFLGRRGDAPGVAPPLTVSWDTAAEDRR